MRMYSTSRWTLVLVLVALMTCLEMYFMATSWPVMVCTASGGLEGEGREVAGSTDLLTFHFAKGALSNLLDDGVLAELGWRVDHLLFRGDRHCEWEGGMWRRESRMRGNYNRSHCRVGVNEMKGKNRVRGCHSPPFC